MRRLLLAALLLLAGGPAWADSGMMMAGVANRQMPFDPISAVLTECYSTRRLRTSYTANKAVNIVRASDSAALDIGFTAAGTPDNAAVATHLAATTGTVAVWYSQCAGARDVSGSAAARPTVVQSCPSAASYCAEWGSGTIILNAGSNITPATGLVTLNAVVNRTVGTGLAQVIRENGASSNRISGRSGAAGLSLAGGTSGSVLTTSADATWHAATGVINGASSVINVDGAETTGTATGSVTAGAPGMAGVASTTVRTVESAIADNYAATASERRYIGNGQHVAFGF